MFETSHARQQTCEALLEVLIEKSVHDRVGADRGHGGQVTDGEQHQRQFLVLLTATERLESINDDVEYVERGPGQEEDDADCYQHFVYLPPSLHLPGSPVRRESPVCLSIQTTTNSK